jgi:hypothetical protein
MLSEDNPLLNVGWAGSERGGDHTTAGAIAHRSAQMPTGVEATSTLPPEKYTPDVSRMEAPTRKLL